MWLATFLLAVQSTEAPWSAIDDFDAALAESRKAGKVVLAFLKQSDCATCRAMLAEAFKDPDVASFVKDTFVPVLVDCDKTQDLVRKLGGSSHHATLFVDAEGRTLVTVATAQYTGPARYLARLKRVSAARKTFEDPKIREEGGAALLKVAVDLEFWDVASEVGVRLRESEDPDTLALTALAVAHMRGDPLDAAIIVDGAIKKPAIAKSKYFERLLECQLDLLRRMDRVGRVEICERALSALPDSPNRDLWHADKVREHLALEQFDQATTAAKTALKELDAKAWSRPRIERDLRLAERLADQLARMKKGERAATSEMLGTFIDAGFPMKALGLAKLMVERGLGEPKVLGEALAAIASDASLDAGASMTAWQLGLDVDPKNASGRRDYFLLHRAQRELSSARLIEAVATAKEALGLASSENEAALWYVIAAAHVRQKATAEALVAIESGLKAKPSETMRRSLEALRMRVQK